jgi:hypothetical protein
MRAILVVLFATLNCVSFANVANAQVILTKTKNAAVLEGAAVRGLLDGYPTQFHVHDGLAITQGDIVLGNAQEIAARMAVLPNKNTSKGNVIAQASRLWPKNAAGVVIVPYTIDTDPDNKVPAAITAANEQLQGVMQWVARTNQTDWVAFDLTEDANFGSCFSAIGRSGGRQRIGGSRACSTGTIIHEMGHAIGLWHEQQRGDEETWVDQDLSNVDPFFANNFVPLTNQRDSGNYDFGSIMHYAPYSFAKTFKPTVIPKPLGIPIGASDRYSETDVEAIRRLYSSLTQQITIDSFPTGFTILVDGQAVTAPAKFNWPIGTTKTLSVTPGIRDTGSALYTFARWSSDTAGTLSPTQTITVTAGNGSVGSPSNAPLISTYTAFFANVIEVRTSSNTAGGSTRLSPEPETIAGAPGKYWRLNQLINNQASAPTGFQFVRWGTTAGLFHYPAASNRNTNPHVASVAVGTDLKVADWTANFSNEAQVFIRAQDGNGFFGGTNFIDRTDVTPTVALNTPESTWTWATSEKRRYKAKTDVLGLTINARYKFQGWTGGPTLSFDEIEVTKPTGGISASQTYIARYLKQFKAFADVDNTSSAACGSVSVNPAPAADGYYDFGTPLTAQYQPPAGMQIVKWTGNFLPTVAANANTAQFTVNDIPEARVEINVNAEPLRITRIVVDPANASQLLINGSGFDPASVVFIDNAFRASTYVSANLLRMPTPDTNQAALAKLNFIVTNNAGSCQVFALGRLSSNPSSAAVQKGWWWNPAESGRGFFIEQQGSTIFMAGYHYADDGRPTWFTSAGTITGNTYNAPAYGVRNGQTLGGAYVSPTFPASILGNVTLNFSGPNQATMTWLGSSTPITRFVFGPSTPPSNIESGWWWNPAESGSGYSLEIQGGILVAKVQMYDAAGEPVWYISAGPMQSATRFQGELSFVSFGQTLNGPYRAPSSIASAGQLAIDFTSSSSANLTLPNGRILPIQRMRYGN